MLEKQKQESSAKKRKRGSADDPICHSFGDFVVVIVKNGPENLCRFRKTNPCPRCKRGDDSKQPPRHGNLRRPIDFPDIVEKSATVEVAAQKLSQLSTRRILHPSPSVISILKLQLSL